MDSTMESMMSASAQALLQKIQKQDEGAQDAKGTDFAQYLVFQVGKGNFGINILDTHEILKPVNVTRLPNVEDEILGVINLRGNIIPVIDMNRKFTGMYTELTPLSRIVVAGSGTKFMGLLVDRIIEVARIREEQVEGVGMKTFTNRFVSGVGRIESRIFLILNLSMLFNYTSK